MFDLTVSGAFIAGVLSFLSPCVLPLVPPYLCYLAGVGFEELAHSSDKKEIRKRSFYRTLSFVAGFTVIFVALGATASTFGQFISDYFSILEKVAGAIIIVLGFHISGILKIPFLYREARFQTNNKPVGILGSFIVGLAFAFGWTPCVGPVLATILMVASTEDSIHQGTYLLASYSLGIGIPFILAAIFVNPFIAFMQKFRRHLRKVEIAVGILLVATGILLITGNMSVLGYGLLEWFPWLGNTG
ncbi:cytochrome c biogenesis CcdA family protein [Sneathiella sp.]|jgi:cytochrome c-type biogenesis protein|uniref:cytochrome c biogenesis CcdA family protein n=1 Tax=Sneathiella sp. TaxID=1964365 RepID=UPI0039E23BA0